MTMQPAGLQDGTTGTEQPAVHRRPPARLGIPRPPPGHHPLRRARARPAGTRRPARGPPRAGAAGLAVLTAVGRPAAAAAGPGAVRGREPRPGRDPPRAPGGAGLAAVRGRRRRDSLAGLVPRAADPGPATPTRPGCTRRRWHGWRQRAGEHEQAELARLDGVPEWASARSPARRTDIYGGTLGGWQVAAGRPRRLGPGRAAAAGRRLLRSARQQRADRARPAARCPRRRLPAPRRPGRLRDPGRAHPRAVRQRAGRGDPRRDLRRGGPC